MGPTDSGGGSRRRRWPFWAGPVLVTASALVILAGADWWRTRRFLKQVASEPSAAAQPWKWLLDQGGAVQRVAGGRMTQRLAVRQAVGSSDETLRLIAAWAVCASGEGQAEAGRIVVDAAMADITVRPPDNPLAAQALAARFVTIQLALKDAGANVVAPLLAVAIDRSQAPARRQLAVATLGLVGDVRARAPLLELLRSDPGDVRVQVYTAVAALHVHEAQGDLRRAALSDPNPSYRRVAAQAYRRLTGERVSGPTTQAEWGAATQGK